MLQHQYEQAEEDLDREAEADEEDEEEVENDEEVENEKNYGLFFKCAILMSIFIHVLTLLMPSPSFLCSFLCVSPAMVGWLMEDYDYPVFELWNVISRGLIIMASTIMFPEKRFYTHVVTMSLSLLITIAFRPYTDAEANITAILFCSVDLLGAISAWQSSTSFAAQGGEPTPGVQVSFVGALLGTMLIVLFLSLKAITERIVELSKALKQKKTRSVCDGYTRCEIGFLFPILCLVYLVDKFARTCCLKPCLWINKTCACTCCSKKKNKKTCACCSKKNGKKTKVIPESERIHDDSIHDDIHDEIAGEERKKLQLERKQKRSSFTAKKAKEAKKEADTKAQDEKKAASNKDNASDVKTARDKALVAATDRLCALRIEIKEFVAALEREKNEAETARSRLTFLFFFNGVLYFLPFSLN